MVRTPEGCKVPPRGCSDCEGLSVQGSYAARLELQRDQTSSETPVGSETAVGSETPVGLGDTDQLSGDEHACPPSCTRGVRRRTKRVRSSGVGERHILGARAVHRCRCLS